MAGKMSFR